MTLSGSKPSRPGYPLKVETLGDHLNKKRLDLRLLQREIGQKIGVDETTIYNWENNRTAPSLYSMPKIIKFLGYNPSYTTPKTLGQKLLAYRKINGITQKKLAQKLGVDPTTLARWEKERSRPSDSYIRAITRFLKSSV